MTEISTASPKLLTSGHNYKAFRDHTFQRGIQNFQGFIKVCEVVL